MLVGKANVNLKELECRAFSPDDFMQYADSLVPEEFRHVPAIISNQRYLCCLLLRTSKTVDWKVKKQLLDTVLQTVKVVGYTNSLIEVGSLMSLVNVERLEKYRKGVKK